MFSKLRALKRFLVLFWGILIFSPLYMVLLRVSVPKAQGFFRLFCLFSSKTIGLLVKVQGQPLATLPTLFVSNHSSYTDILVLGYLLPASFVAKKEVKKWPFFGWVAGRQGTLFVTRTRRATVDGVSNLQQSLLQGKSLILFPEGTSNNGCHILPFRSSFFDVLGLKARQPTFSIQPISLVYTSVDGLPMGRFLKQLYAWTGGINLLSHVWRISQLKKVTAVVKFHPPLDLSQVSSRKELAQMAWQQVQDGFFEK